VVFVRFVVFSRGGGPPASLGARWSRAGFSDPAWCAGRGRLPHRLRSRAISIILFGFMLGLFRAVCVVFGFWGGFCGVFGWGVVFVGWFVVVCCVIWGFGVLGWG